MEHIPFVDDFPMKTSSSGSPSQPRLIARGYFFLTYFGNCHLRSFWTAVGHRLISACSAGNGAWLETLWKRGERSKAFKPSKMGIAVAMLRETTNRKIQQKTNNEQPTTNNHTNSNTNTSNNNNNNNNNKKKNKHNCRRCAPTKKAGMSLAVQRINV